MIAAFVSITMRMTGVEQEVLDQFPWQGVRDYFAKEKKRRAR